MRRRIAAAAAAGMLALGACSGGGANLAAGRAADAEARVDRERLMADLRALAHDSLAGRRTGTPGSAGARRLLVAELGRIGLLPFAGGYEREFTFQGQGGAAVRGVNLVGWVRGTERPDRYILVTAHYDHVGVGRAAAGDSIYNGADDNASGTAALLEIARWFRRNPPRTSLVFAALDAEEMGLRGARALVAAPPVPKEAIALNVNMDMVGRNERGELYAAGAHHTPALRPHLERVAAAAPVKLRLGHDSPDLGSNDWTSQSDHGAFHAAGIPFVYFGVEDHPDYHRPSDHAERIDPAFFAGATETVIRALEELDRNLPAISAARR